MPRSRVIWINPVLVNIGYSSDFETRIELQGQGGDDSRYSLAGSSFTLSDAAITSKERQARPWSASIKVEKAEFAEVEKPGGRQFSLPGGEYLMSGDVSDIGFINPLLGKLEQLSFGGSATGRRRFYSG